MQQVQNGVAQAAKAAADAYRGDEDRPLGGYVVVMAAFAALLSGAAGLALATGRRLPPGVGPWDVLLLAAAAAEVMFAVGVVDVVARTGQLLGVACGFVAAVLGYLPAANRWFTTRRR